MADDIAKWVVILAWVAMRSQEALQGAVEMVANTEAVSTYRPTLGTKMNAMDCQTTMGPATASAPETASI
jgi:hypothetical protein